MHGAAGDLFLVRVHPADYGRFESDRDLLEARWSALLHEAQPPGRRIERVRAVLHEDSAVVAGSVIIEVVREEAPHILNEADVAPLEFVVDWCAGRAPIRAGLRLGRAADNDVVLPDRRVSRYHARIVAVPGGLAVEDLGSVNGTFVGALPATSEPLEAGTIVTLGDTQLRIERNAR